jgi:hypothetical protein
LLKKTIAVSQNSNIPTANGAKKRQIKAEATHLVEDYYLMLNRWRVPLDRHHMR